MRLDSDLRSVQRRRALAHDWNTIAQDIHINFHRRPLEDISICIYADYGTEWGNLELWWTLHVYYAIACKCNQVSVQAYFYEYTSSLTKRVRTTRVRKCERSDKIVDTWPFKDCDSVREVDQHMISGFCRHWHIWNMPKAVLKQSPRPSFWGPSLPMSITNDAFFHYVFGCQNADLHEQYVLRSPPQALQNKIWITDFQTAIARYCIVSQLLWNISLSLTATSQIRGNILKWSLYRSQHSAGIHETRCFWIQIIFLCPLRILIMLNIQQDKRWLDNHTFWVYFQSKHEAETMQVDSLNISKYNHV